MPRAHRSAIRRSAVLLALALAAGATTGCDTPIAGPPPVTVPLSAVVVSPETDSAQVGETRIFTATAYDTLGAMVEDARFTWTSENTGIFTVLASGRVRAVGEGAADLIVESNGKRDTARVFVYADTGWVLQPNPSNGSNLNGVQFMPDGRRGWVVGDAGRILRTTDAGANWTAMSSGTAFNLNAVWFTSETQGWAVGNGSTVLRTTNGGTSWARVTSANPGENLMDVVFTTATTGFAVGTNGTIIRTTDGGTTWTETNLPTAFALHAVAFGSAADGWAVGAGGVIAATHNGGVSWDIVSSITTLTLYGVWPTGSESAYAAGDQGVTARTSAPGSDTWELAPNVGAFNDVEGIHFPTASIGFAVGYNAGGLALRTGNGGDAWVAQAPRTAVRLSDVWFVDTLRGWAVGEGGVIVHTGTGGGGF